MATQANQAPTGVPTAGPPSEEPTLEDLMGQGGTPIDEDWQMANAWLAERILPTLNRMPFSFVLDGQRSNALLPNWRFTQTQTSLDPNQTRHIYTYLDPASQLEVQAVFTVYHDYPAVEWVLYLENNGAADTPVLEEIRALDANLGLAAFLPPSPEGVMLLTPLPDVDRRIVHAVALDEHTLVAATPTNSLFLFQHGEVTSELSMSSLVNAMTVLPGGKVAVGLVTGEVHEFDDRLQMSGSRLKLPGRITGLAARQDGGLTVTYGSGSAVSDYRVEQYDSSGNLLTVAEVGAPTRGVTTLGDLAIYANAWGEAGAVDSRGQVVWQALTQHPLNAVASASSANAVFTADAHGGIGRLAADGSNVWYVTVSENQLLSAYALPDGSAIVAGAEDGSVFALDGDGIVKFTQRLTDARIQAVTPTKAGAVVAVASNGAQFGLNLLGLNSTSRQMEFTLHYSNGSVAAPNDFQLQQWHPFPGEQKTLAPFGGRSSDTVLPFFNLERTAGDGIVLGIGWSGQWQLTCATNLDGGLQVTAGMEHTHLRLHPGERIRTPGVLLLFWQGSRLHGHNLLRRHLLAHHTPTQAGKPFRGPIWASGTGDLGFNDITEENQVASVQAVAANSIPLEYWQIDAGWFVNGWPNTGTWEPHRDRFPHGLKPVGDAAHEAGLGFILWFEPERVMPGTALRSDHPEWLLAPADLPSELNYQANWRLLNLGDQAALAWVKDKISGLIQEYGVDVYRHDFNMHPLFYWRANDAPDRQGMTEIRYVEGFYEYWDHLVSQHPNLLIDNSASGGRRLDLETISRSVPLFRTDYFWVAEADQDMTYALSHWLPISAQGVHATAETYTFRSGMGTSVCLAYNFLAGAPWDWLRTMLAEYQDIREYFYGDYFPLFAGNSGHTSWVAYQFDREDLGEGMVLVFKRDGANSASLVLKLLGLKPALTYELIFRDSNESQILTGSEASSSGLTVTLSGVRSSALITYRSI